MTDVMTPTQRSFNMSRIKRADTKPELLLRSYLHKSGLRYRLHRRDLPGKPDLCLARARVVIFTHGCFWHQHRCVSGRLPSSNADFWRAKLTRNIERDSQNVANLVDLGWRVMVVWECSLRGRRKLNPDIIVNQVLDFLDHGTDPFKEISGNLAP